MGLVCRLDIRTSMPDEETLQEGDVWMMYDTDESRSRVYGYVEGRIVEFNAEV